MGKPNPFLIPVATVNTQNQNEPPRFHQYYVGIDIGYKFHEVACIPAPDFFDEKSLWKKRKTVKLNADGIGITGLISFLAEVSCDPKAFCILMEPTGGYYGYTVMQALKRVGYTTYLVENKAVKDFRERTLGISEKTDRIDSKVLAYMGFQKALTPSMHGIRLMNDFSPEQILFKALTTDRWQIKKQITRRKNQLQQILSVTNPELKSVFKTSTGTHSVRQLVTKYPTAQDMAKVSQEDLYKDLIATGAKSIAKRASVELSKLLASSAAVNIPHLIPRQKFLIEDIDRLETLIDNIDNQIDTLLQHHPYTPILASFPVTSNTWTCTLIGVIGDVERFGNYKEFKKYLGFTAENKESGISVKGTKLSKTGVRDSRRVLFQMALTLMAPNAGENPFKLFYHRLTQRNMAPMKAMGHVCGKLAQVLYSCLKNRSLYDSEKHYKALGLDKSDSLVE